MVKSCTRCCNCKSRSHTLSFSVKLSRVHLMANSASSLKSLEDSLILWDIEFVFEKLQPRDQSRQPFFFTLVIKLVQALVRFALASFAVGKLVGGKALVIAGGPGQGRRLGEKFGRVFVVFILLLVKARERFVELRAIGIIFYSALKKIFAKREIFPLRLDPQSETRLGSIVHCSHARIPGHVPCRHVPK